MFYGLLNVFIPSILPVNKLSCFNDSNSVKLIGKTSGGKRKGRLE
jgi:hypothetical protein